MATLFNEIFSAIRGRCISDESASVAAAEVAELVVKKFTPTNTGSPKLPGLGEAMNDLSALNSSLFDALTFQHGAKEMYEYIARQLRAGA